MHVLCDILHWLWLTLQNRIDSKKSYANIELDLVMMRHVPNIILKNSFRRICLGKFSLPWRLQYTKLHHLLSHLRWTRYLLRNSSKLSASKSIPTGLGTLRGRREVMEGEDSGHQLTSVLLLCIYLRFVQIYLLYFSVPPLGLHKGAIKSAILWKYFWSDDFTLDQRNTPGD